MSKCERWPNIQWFFFGIFAGFKLLSHWKKAQSDDCNISISLDLSKDIHTVNKYNKIYIPQKFRFFFPKTGTDFILNTNIGNIRTHITASGYFSAGMQGWFKINGPVDYSDKIFIKSLDGEKINYELMHISKWWKKNHYHIMSI